MPTKMATAAVLAGAGDVIAQRIEASGPFAIRRFLTLIAVNVLCTQPRPALALDTLSRALRSLGSAALAHVQMLCVHAWRLQRAPPSACIPHPRTPTPHQTSCPSSPSSMRLTSG